MKKATILVSGKNGQLGREIQEKATAHPGFNFIFCDRGEMDIADPQATENVFKRYQPDYFINTAAYTAVDKAESEKEQAFLINATAVGELSKLCKKSDTKLIHLSTDYVFNGNADKPYSEIDATAPVNYYGFTKLEGENLALKFQPQTIILRTSWVYGKYGNNFVKTMIRLMNDRPDINVVNDQWGTPTYAKDLAEAILMIIEKDRNKKVPFRPGIYHYSNEGKITWYQFAAKIAELKGSTCQVHPIETSQFPTAAKRPAFSVLNKEKIQSTYQIPLKNWEDSLRQFLQQL